MLVHITGFHLDASGSTAVLDLRYSNENVFGLAIEKTNGSLYLNDQYIGEFEQNSAVGVAQLSTATSKAILVIKKPAEFQALAQATSSASLNYRLVSKMHLEISDGKTTIKNTSTGLLERSQLLAGSAK